MDAKALEVSGLRVAVFDQSLVATGTSQGRAKADTGLPEGWVEALHTTDFALERGEVLGVVGRAGSGKSLLATGVLALPPLWARIVGGRVGFAGDALWPTPPMLTDGQYATDEATPHIDPSLDRAWRKAMRNRIGVVLQDALLSAERQSVAGFVREALPRRAKRAGDVLSELAEVLRLGDKLHDNELHMWDVSRGEQQRIALAVALAKKPELLVVDEPFSAVDASTTADVVCLIREQAAHSGMSSLVATNDLALAQILCDRFLVLESGHVVAQGELEADEVRAWFGEQRG